MAKMFVCDTNAGRDIAVTVDGRWFFHSCASSGKWGDIDITRSKAENIATAISNAIRFKGYDDPDTVANDAMSEAECNKGTMYEMRGWHEVEAYEGMSAAEIENYENGDRTFDLTSFYEINAEQN